ncbi:hypothetical protein HYH03_004564 [Edaphochlamys debaryana]|uniref:Uncharacterized protein n=1 Tax=Edaphochlamys debaryana TaxID=47281 RepID=A0A836C384_9CHLO|nr:hypothetical protein HYH03_004564 [Edaphochlamys debaryana]|eukprot:KAG2497409.1 hypothetical protein HYH03_004564 [Edaphochlamys debaryana]
MLTRQRAQRPGSHSGSGAGVATALRPCVGTLAPAHFPQAQAPSSPGTSLSRAPAARASSAPKPRSTAPSAVAEGVSAAAGSTEADWAPLNGLTAVIVGAGPAGCTLAMYLARQGWRVRVFEKRPEPGPATTSRQRSWVLAMYPRGIRPISHVAHVPLLVERAYKGLVVKPAKADAKPVVLERTGVLMDRTLLATALLDTVRQSYSSRVSFTFDAPLADVDLARKTATFTHAASTDATVTATAPAAAATAGAGRTGSLTADYNITSGRRQSAEADYDMTSNAVPYDLLVGADGANSRTRELLGEAFPGQFETEVLTPSESAYKAVYGLPPLPEVSAWDPDSGTPQGERLPGQFFFFLSGGDTSKGFMSVCRDLDGTYCGYLAGKLSNWEGLKTKEDYLALLPKAAPHLPPAWLPLMAQQLLDAPLSRFPAMRSLSRFWAPGGVVMVGDAAHTVTPSLGQGLNSAVQDCEILAGELRGVSAGGEALDAALRRFSEGRAPEVRALQDLELLQSAGLSRLPDLTKEPIKGLSLVLRKWIVIQYSGLAFIGTIAATAAAARRKDERKKAAAAAAGGGGGADGKELAAAAAAMAAAAASGDAAAAAVVADVLATQLEANYVRSPPFYELLRGHMGYREMLTRVYGMAAAGTGITAALLYGMLQGGAALLARVTAGL